MMHQKILIADSDVEYRFLLCSLLRIEGFNAIPAENCQDALELLHNDTFALIITDCITSDTNGLILATLVNKLFPQVNIFLMTTNIMSDVENNPEYAGISSVFTKPLDLEILLKAIRSFFYKKMDRI